MFQLTTEPLTKLAPFTVRVNPDTLHDGVEFDCVVEADTEVTEGATIANAVCPDVPPPGVIVNTLTCAVPTARKSTAGTVAVNCDALTYAVGSELVTLLAFTHCTVEQGRRFDPFTVKLSAGLPAAADVCDSDATVGATSEPDGVESVKGLDAEVPIELVTVTAVVPGKPATAGEITTVS